MRKQLRDVQYLLHVLPEKKHKIKAGVIKIYYCDNAIFLYILSLLCIYLLSSARSVDRYYYYVGFDYCRLEISIVLFLFIFLFSFLASSMIEIGFIAINVDCLPTNTSALNSLTSILTKTLKRVRTCRVQYRCPVLYSTHFIQ